MIIMVSGCQATPQDEVVVNKSDDQLMTIIGQPPAEEKRYEAPEDWNDRFESEAGNIDVIIDAQILVPDTTKYPVVSIVPADITQAQADLIIETLLQDAPKYKPKTEEEMTKDDIDEIIISLKQCLVDPNSNINSIKDINPDGYQNSVNEYLQEIADWEEKKLTAPDDYIRQAATGMFERMQLSQEEIENLPADADAEAYEKYWASFQEINIEAEAGKARPASLYICKNESNRANYVSFDNYEYEQRNPDIAENSTDIPGMAYTLQEALAIAQDTVKALGLDDMKPAYLAACPYSDEYHSGPLEDRQRSYLFYFTRTIEGVPTTYTQNQNNLYEDDAYFEPWEGEQVTITIGNQGLQSFAWHAPANITSTLSENVALLSFDTIMDKFQSHILICEAWTSDPSIVQRTINISKITLGMGRIAKKDDPGTYLLVPVWDFFGYSVVKYSDEIEDPNFNENNEYTESLQGYSYMTINAIDGSIIDKGVGY